MPSIIGKCKLFRIKHIIVLEGDTFLTYKHKTAFFEIKYTFFGRKENVIIQLQYGITNLQQNITFSFINVIKSLKDYGLEFYIPLF